MDKSHALLILVVGSLFATACSVDNSSATQRATPDRAPNGDGITAPPSLDDPGEDESGEEPAECQTIAPAKIAGWASYSNGHFGFQAPREIFLELLGRTAPVTMTSELRDNTDPVVSKYFAETVVQQSEAPLLAYHFIIRVSELAAPGTPADRLAELAKRPQGLPPPEREHNHECGVVSAAESTYACLPAVDAAIGCNTIRGYSYEWSRFVYSKGRAYEMTCTGSGIVTDKDKLCAKILDSLTISE